MYCVRKLVSKFIYLQYNETHYTYQNERIFINHVNLRDKKLGVYTLLKIKRRI